MNNIQESSNKILPNALNGVQKSSDFQDQDSNVIEEADLSKLGLLVGIKGESDGR